MTLKEKRQWYVLYTSARAEKQVKKRLDSLEVENWLPLHRSPRIWSDRVKMVEIPLFSSYIFVHCQEQELSSIVKVYGVSHVVQNNGKAAVIRPKELESIHAFLLEAENKSLLVGEEAEILCGALKKVTGKICRIKNKYILLRLDQLGATVCVESDKIKTIKCMK